MSERRPKDDSKAVTFIAHDSIIVKERHEDNVPVPEVNTFVKMDPSEWSHICEQTKMLSAEKWISQSQKQCTNGTA